jgi:hypothetical protein
MANGSSSKLTCGCPMCSAHFHLVPRPRRDPPTLRAIESLLFPQGRQFLRAGLGVDPEQFM